MRTDGESLLTIENDEQPPVKKLHLSDNANQISADANMPIRSTDINHRNPHNNVVLEISTETYAPNTGKQSLKCVRYNL